MFDTVTPGRCDELLRWSGSRKILLELAGREGLVRRDPFDSETFHYNPVLRDHLRVQLREQLGAEHLRTVHALAIDVLARAEAPREEATARARAADWSGLSGLLHRHGALLTRPDTSTWLDLLPRTSATTTPGSYWRQHADCSLTDGPKPPRRPLVRQARR